MKKKIVRPRLPDNLPLYEPYLPTTEADAIIAYGQDTNDPALRNWYDPTDHPPGSKEKIEVLRARAARSAPLFHPEDRRIDGHRAAYYLNPDNETYGDVDYVE